MSVDVGSVPTALLLAGGAGAVIGTAAALSGRAARHPDLPSQRWSAPLPAALGRMVDARTTRVVLRGAGLVATIAGVIALAGRGTGADGLVVIPALTAVSLVAGPVFRLVNPVRALAPRPTEAATADHGRPTPWFATGVRGAAVWLIGLCVIALSTDDPPVLAATAAGYVLAQAAVVWRTGRRDDPLETYAELLGHLAPIGRDRDRRLVWRNPLVATAHATLPPGAVAFSAVIIAASITHAAAPRPAALAGRGLIGSATPALLFGATVVIVAGALRLAVVRAFLRGAIVPVAAAYGAVAAGRWWQPLDLLVFVALHALAVGVLHRQAVARYDLRTARAVQFPLRVALLASVVGGLGLLAGR